MLTSPDWADDLAAFRRELAAAPLVPASRHPAVKPHQPPTGSTSPATRRADGGAPGRPYDPLVVHAAARGRIGLWNGQTVTLIAARGNRLRITNDTGHARTIGRAELAHIYPLEQS